MAATDTEQRSNVLVLVGTRPEAIKMFPVVLALRRSTWFAPVVVTTGQHRDLVAPDPRPGRIEPDLDLDVGHPGLTLNDLVSSVIERLDAFCRERFQATGAAVATREQVRESGFPAGALVHGDTSSAAAAALAAFNLRIPVGHVEAGLRTGSTLTPFPEELNRQLISRIAAFHLAPTTIEQAEPRARGDPGRAHLRHRQHRHRRAASSPPARTRRSRTRPSPPPSSRATPYVVVTAHRRENWNGGLGADRRGDRPAGRRASGRPLRRAAAPEPARAERARRAARRPTRTWC